MTSLAEHRIRITYTGGPADHNTLPAYDGATSIDGIIRALHITTHAYMTGQVVSRATALKGASMIMKPARQGSFLVDLIVLIETYPGTTGLAGAVLAAPFYDFVKTAFKRATGSIDAEPESKLLIDLYKRKEPPPLKRHPADLDELAEALEGSLQDAHRPIGVQDSVSRILISSPRKSLTSFDLETKDWVNTREEAVSVETYEGSVTRFNAISRNGRAFVDELERVVPIRPGTSFSSAALANLTWSLHGSNVGGRKKLALTAHRVCSASGKVKRLVLVDSAKSTNS